MRILSYKMQNKGLTVYDVNLFQDEIYPLIV